MFKCWCCCQKEQTSYFSVPFSSLFTALALVSYGCAVNWVWRLMEIKISPVKCSSFVLTQESSLTLISYVGLPPNQVYIQGGIGVEKQKWGCSIPTKHCLILAYLGVSRNSWENILKALDYAGAMDPSAVYLCHIWGVCCFLTCFNMSKRMPLSFFSIFTSWFWGAFWGVEYSE